MITEIGELELIEGDVAEYSGSVTSPSLGAVMRTMTPIQKSVRAHSLISDSYTALPS